MLLLAVAMIAAVAGGLVWATHSDSAASGLAPPQGNYSVDEAKTFTRFPLYYAGDSVAGYQLHAIEKTTDADHGSTNITFLYGDCIPPQDSNGSYDGGCPPPVQVQVWSACDRNPSLYGGPGSPTPQETTVRGVPAAYYESGTRLELQTGTSTVVIFAHAPASVAAALRGVNNNVTAGVDLPAPAAGVMTGDLKC